MKNKFLQRLLIIVVLIILFACIGLTNGKSRRVTAIETIIGNIIISPQKLFTYLKSFIVKDSEFFETVDELKKENEELKLENEELKEKDIDYEVLLSENKVLKEHMKNIELYPNYEIVVAEIISDSVSNWEEVYIINKGASDGIKENMAVITGDGLVGYISSVDEKTSKIISILDAGSSVSSRITKSRDAVMCKGSNTLKESNKMRVTYIPIGVELTEGDKVETSGMGGIYPKGIAIGEIKSFSTKKNPSENEAIVETYVNFNKLETVAVIIKGE